MGYIHMIVPAFILIIFLTALKEKQDILKLFTDGIIDGLNTVLKIFPHIMAITIAISLLRESGLISFILKPIQSILIKIGVTEGIVPLIVFRPLSGGASTSIVMDIFKTYGADSIEGKLASVIMGGTETTFYVITLLFGTLKIKKLRGTLIAALFADIVAVITAIILINVKMI